MAHGKGHRDYKYDVAFSLLDRDRTYAEHLNAKLKERFTTFLYSEQQKSLTFDNALEQLTAVYAQEARIVVVLVRRDYGDTLWTRVEKQTIETRIIRETPRFLIMIAMEEIPIPTWIPPQYFFAWEEQWKPEDLIAVASGRIKELGGTVQRPNAIELARGHAIERDWQERHQQLLNTEASARLDAEFDSLIREVETQVSEIQPNLKGQEILVKKGPQGLAVNLPPSSFFVFKSVEQDREIYPYYHQLRVREFDGMLDETGSQLSGRLACWADRSYAIDVNSAGRWHLRAMSKTDTLTPADLANDLLLRLLRRSDNVRTGKTRAAYNEEGRRPRRSGWVNGWRD